MVDSSPDDSDQLSANIDCLRACPLIVALVPLLHAAFHLHRIVGCQRQKLGAMMSSHSPSRNKVVQWKRVEGPESTPQTLHGLIDRLSQRIYAVRIVVSGPGVLDVVSPLELLEALCTSVVDVLGVGDELGRRSRSIGSRHFEWRMGWWFERQRLTLLLSAHDRHALLWSSLPLPRNSSIRWSDKPQIFFSHSDPKPFGVWCYFYLHLTHHCSIFVTPLSSDPPLSPIAPLWFPVNPPIRRDSESSYSFYSYLSPMFIIGYGPCSSPYSFCKQSTRKYHEVASKFLISLCNPTVGCNSYEKLCNSHIGRLQYFSWGSAMMGTRMVGPPADPH